MNIIVQIVLMIISLIIVVFTWTTNKNIFDRDSKLVKCMKDDCPKDVVMFI